MQFKGIFSDIVVRPEAEATVTLLSDRMTIEIPSRNETREWFYGMVRKKSKNASRVILTHKDPTKSRLTIADPQFMIEVERIAPYAEFTQPTPWFRSKNGMYVMFATKVGSIAAVLLLLVFGATFFVGLIVSNISKDTENTIGDKLYDMMMLDLRMDTAQTRLVNEFFSKLNGGEKDVRIVVLKSDIKNAYAFPGNHIVVEAGILPMMKDYSELAAVLGHEDGHVKERDPLKMLCRKSATGILITAIMGDMNGVINIIVRNGAELNNLSYSRECETNADRFSYDLVKKNNINPQGLVDVFTSLAKDIPSFSSVEFISDHPSMEKRIENVKEWMKKDGTTEVINNEELERLWQQIKANAHSDNQ